MDIKEEFSTKKIILLIMPGVEYNHIIIGVIKKLAEKNVVYVTLNKTYESLKELFKEKGVNTKNITFIDGITKTIKKVPDSTDGCYFVSSPGALTEISIAVSKMLNHNFDYLIFDSLTNLLVYEKKAPVARFVSDMVNKIRVSKTKAVFYALSVKEQQSLIEESSMFVDEVIDMSKQK